MNANIHSQSENDRCSLDLPSWMHHILKYLKQMDYGQITLTVHQGKVVEIQRTERTRFPTNKAT